jgi:hypothetical protein
MERTEILSSGMKDHTNSQPVELEALAVAPQSFAVAAAAAAVAVAVVAVAAEPACFHCLLHEVPQYDPLKPAVSPDEALVLPGDPHSV